MSDIQSNNEMIDVDTETLVELNDEALQSIAGGCTSSCGGGLTTIDTSCVRPGVQCP